MRDIKIQKICNSILDEVVGMPPSTKTFISLLKYSLLDEMFSEKNSLT